MGWALAPPAALLAALAGAAAMSMAALASSHSMASATAGMEAPPDACGRLTLRDIDLEMKKKIMQSEVLYGSCVQSGYTKNI